MFLSPRWIVGKYAVCLNVWGRRKTYKCNFYVTGEVLPLTDNVPVETSAQPFVRFLASLKNLPSSVISATPATLIPAVVVKLPVQIPPGD